MISILLMLSQFAAAEEYAPRIDTLRFHVERLGAPDFTHDQAVRPKPQRGVLAAPSPVVAGR